MKLREQSQVGYLMAQYVGAICLTTAAKEAVAVRAAARARTGAKLAAAAERFETMPLPPTRPDPVTFTTGEMLHWPSAEAMLAGEPPMMPEEFDRAMTRAAVETSGAVIAVDPEAGTVTVSGAPATRVCACSRVVPATEWDHLYDSCSECAEQAASYGNNWRAAWADLDRDRLVQEKQAGA